MWLSNSALLGLDFNEYCYPNKMREVVGVVLGLAWLTALKLVDCPGLRTHLVLVGRADGRHQYVYYVNNPLVSPVPGENKVGFGGHHSLFVLMSCKFGFMLPHAFCKYLGLLNFPTD